MAYDKKAQQKYAKKTRKITVSYRTEDDVKLYNVFAQYLDTIGMKSNTYVKRLIARDMLDKQLVSREDVSKYVD